jgi:hypothetical protein
MTDDERPIWDGDSGNDGDRLDAESIILEILPDGWSARKLTRIGWLTGSAVTLDAARSVLGEQIRLAHWYEKWRKRRTS